MKRDAEVKILWTPLVGLRATVRVIVLCAGLYTCVLQMTHTSDKVPNSLFTHEIQNNEH